MTIQDREITARFQKQIDRCSEAGGGTVVLPTGVHKCGTLLLRSGVCLHLPKGCTLKASSDHSLFPVIAKTENLPGQIQALIWAERADWFSITGQGRILGEGEEMVSWEEAGAQLFRPALLFCRDCEQVTISDVTFQHSTFWTIHLLRCRHVHIYGLTIQNHRPNGDGIDPDGCSNVIINDCTIETGDDCIVLKSTEGDTCEKVVVTNCVLSSRCAALKLGTESLGEIRNVTFSNCVIRKSNIAAALYMKDGGVYEDVLFSGLTIEAEARFPLIVDITPRDFTKPSGGAIRRIRFENIFVRAAGRIYLEGLPHLPIQDLAFRKLHWEIIDGGEDFGGSVKPAGSGRVNLDPSRPNFASQPYQFLAAHVQGLTVDAITVTDVRTRPRSDRSFVWMKDVEDAQLGSYQAVQGAPYCHELILEG